MSCFTYTAASICDDTTSGGCTLRTIVRPHADVAQAPSEEFRRLILVQKHGRSHLQPTYIYRHYTTILCSIVVVMILDHSLELDPLLLQRWMYSSPTRGKGDALMVSSAASVMVLASLARGS